MPQGYEQINLRPLKVQEGTAEQKKILDEIVAEEGGADVAAIKMVAKF